MTARLPANRPSPDGRRRPRVPAAERRQSILEAAARVFAEFGFAGARTRGIAQECGINEAILFRHFRSKERLFQEVLEHCIAGQDIEGFLKDLPPDVSPDATFASIATHILELGRANPIVHRLLIGASVAGTPETLATYVAWRQPFVSHLEKLIEEGVADGTFRPVNPRLSARAFVGMVMDCVLSCDLWEGLGYGGTEAAELVRNNVPTYVRGLLAAPPPIPGSDSPRGADDPGATERR